MKRTKPNRLALSKLTLRQISTISGAAVTLFLCYTRQANCDYSGNDCVPPTADWRC